ncbi:hypothetical protein [Hyphomonas oceanitis]|uniref:hypothetical protein n=1 Tax=Hyphomonas oceanitis TaxID=81033 RepID=UPI0030025114
MILRRVISHVKNQEWTAIAIDFLIVVFGVFAGFQVNNWNEARQDRARAAVYTERLKAELHAELEYASALLQYNSVASKAGEAAYLGLSGQAVMDDETILINAYRASQYNWYERRRATFDEIVASGSLALISDVGLRETAIGIYNTPMFSIVQSEGQSSRYRDLFRMAIEPSLHRDLSENCGDREYATKGAAVGLLTIDYPCTLTVSPEEMAKGVLALRSDPEVARALKLRNAQMSGRMFDLESTIRVYGLKTLFEGQRTP